MNGKKGFTKFMDKKMFVNIPKEKMNEEFRNMRTEENLSNVVNTSERRILFYKTKICPWYIKGKCERRKTCLYAHAQNELRELPNLCKTSLCPKLKINESCNDKKCKYAHTNIELRATENLYKTALCESFIKGKCFSGQFCRYAHGQNELRENPMEITDKNIIIGTSKMKMDKLDYEKKKSANSSCSSMNNLDSGKRNETYCVMPKKKEIHFNKVSALTEDDGVCDITEAMETQAVNDNSTTDNSYEYNKKTGEHVLKNGSNSSSCNSNNNNRIHSKNMNDYNKKNHKNHKYNRNCDINMKNSKNCDISCGNTVAINNNGINNATSSSVGNYLKHEDYSKFSEDQFFNDNLNVLGFLEEYNNGMDKFRKGSNNTNNHMVNELGSNCTNCFSNGNVVCGGSTGSNSSAQMKYLRNNNKGIMNSSNNNSSCSLINFNITSPCGTNMDMHSHNKTEENYYSFSAGGTMEKMNYDDFFFGSTLNGSNDMVGMSGVSGMSDMSSVNGVNGVSNMDDGSRRQQQQPHLCKNMLSKELKSTETRNEYASNNRSVDGNMINECIMQANANNKLRREMDNSESFVSWENFSLFGKTKTFNPGKDYFKIFNYGMCNNFDKKLFDNCDVHKAEMDKVDKSLFIL
ncbi:zinc finger protein, putative [Plasmodium ovale]|uniref:Zinc finger protein, putative n=1 Tax=Plasmodium ovale TaxID=36330 RepID=A0A1C3KQE8_PLAOA|nr:zinc finger protein, putative [Plasmodium ovale]